MREVIHVRCLQLQNGIYTYIVGIKMFGPDILECCLAFQFNSAFDKNPCCRHYCCWNRRASLRVTVPSVQRCSRDQSSRGPFRLAVMRTAPIAKQLFAFGSFFIENLQVLPNGKILLSTLESSGLLYVVDPTVQDPTATQVANLPNFDNVTGLTGMAPVTPDLYAVTGGIHTSFAFEEDSMHLYLVSLAANAVVDDIAIPGTSTLNGLAALPEHPYILLSADSIEGRIMRINTLTKNVSVVAEGAALAPVAGASTAVGINGLKIYGDCAYYTNSNLGTFGRFRIDSLGNQVGDFEILATLASADDIFDDFTFDSAGNAYAAVHSYSVVKISPNGDIQTLIAGSANSSLLHEPTSVALANDGKSIYVSTGGDFTATPVTGGQLVQVWV